MDDPSLKNEGTGDSKDFGDLGEEEDVDYAEVLGGGVGGNEESGEVRKKKHKKDKKDRKERREKKDKKRKRHREVRDDDMEEQKVPVEEGAEPTEHQEPGKVKRRLKRMRDEEEEVTAAAVITEDQPMADETQKEADADSTPKE